LLDQETAAPASPAPVRTRRDRAGGVATEIVGPVRDPATRDGGVIVELASRLPATPVLPERREPAAPPARIGLIAKRAIDLLGAVVGLVLIGPLLLGTAALIALFDGRPVLFRQERAGLDERPFRIYKFRTMRLGADAERAALRANNEVNGGASFKMTDDPRVTRLGRVLRRTSIDEFPQLLNVLRGEMSLVGPRPHPFDDLAGYQSWHHARTAMKPGMTGLWQVSSRRDPDFDRWVELDLEYIRTWSPWLDIKIIARTIPAMLRSEGR
jgi:lipopolysaccharide/colanic/teichoic acid biosynthesis glycosyltransferase